MTFDSSDMREVTVRSPWGGRTSYMAYPIDTIYALDKKGVRRYIVNSPAIEMRVTTIKNKKINFYFDLVEFNGEYIIGGQSRIMPFVRKKVPIVSVKKIEIQDGRKKYQYVK